MAEKNRLMKIRSSLERHIGDKVRLTTKVGRKNVMIRNGIIEGIYPSVFIVRLSNVKKSGISESRMSFSYTDVLTKAVEIQLYRNQA
ncbi:MAG: Veg family protein [Clostridia bacterium]|nr:Veg family protein [Clostridia bacterium]